MTAPAPVTTLPDEDPSFDAAYQSARDRLRSGDFAGAAAGFAAAARLARNPCNRALAEEQRATADDWSSKDLTLVPRSAPTEGARISNPGNMRTSDEIVSLYTNAVLYGLGTGVGLDTFEQGSVPSAAIILPPLLAAGLSVGAVAGLDASERLAYGVPQSIVTGMYLGLEEGVAWSLWQSTGAANWSPQAVATVIWSTTTIGAVTGGVVAEVVGTTPGRASFVGSAGLWTGVLSGLTAAALTGAIPNDSNAGSAPLAVGAVGVTAGSIAGILAAGPVSPSIAHVRFIDLGGIAGFLVGGGLYLAAADTRSDVHAFSGAAALGTGLGLAIATYATRSMPRDEGAREAHGPAASAWIPTVAPTRYGATIGIAGPL